jgi:hypothetical protein
MMANHTRDETTPITRADAPGDAVLSKIVQTLRGLRYGVVSIIVQDGVVVQIERTEKHRLRKSEAE